MAFSDFVGLSVNSTALSIKVANVTLRSLIQGKLHNDKVGITEVYSTDASAGGAILRVPKIANATGRFRQLGNATNGGFFNSNTAAVNGLTEEKIVCDYIYDDMEDVPQAQTVLSLAGASAVGVRAERIGKAIVKDMNAGTMAAQLAAVINAVITAGAHTDRIYTYSAATAGDPLVKFNEANAELDNGDGSYNDYFPVEGRICIARPSMLADLRKTGNIILSGSNFAQDIIRTGAVDSETVLPELNVAYRGMVDNVALFSASKALWTYAEEWMQQSAGYLDNVVGILCAYNATGRGYAVPEQMKVIDSPSGVGLRIQPLSNFGVTVFFEGGIKLFADTTFVEGATPITLVAKGSQA